jgi:glutamine amidotransferase
MSRLDELKLTPLIKEQVGSGKPFLGICLGYQLLFETSSEGGDVRGLGILKGTVERFPATVKVPQMGWNTIEVTPAGAQMYQGMPKSVFVYFCHSYYAKPADALVSATLTDYGVRYASSVCVKNIWGVQFHPEKSQAVGLVLLRNFVQL